MKVCLAIDSFKNTLKSTTLNNICKKICLANQIDVVSLPMADGGENTLDSLAYQHRNLKKHKCKSCNAFLKPIETYYLIDEVKNVAYIEVAKIVGFALNRKKNPLKASSYGVGILILDAIRTFSVKEIYLCLGGSISNDFGLGMLEALGVQFFDENQEIIHPVLLENMETISYFDAKKCTFETKFYILSDVENPLLGLNGASCVYGQQKGLSFQQCQYYDDRMKNLLEKWNIDDMNQKGAGAAGGIGFAALHFLKATYFSGIHFLLQYHQFNKLIADCDYIITGEGQVDAQSFQGKVISGILKEAKDKKVTILCAKSLLSNNNIFAIETYFPLTYSLKNPRKCFQAFFEIIIKDSYFQNERNTI